MNEPTVYKKLTVDFLAALEEVPWFANVGKSTAHDSDVQRFYRWEDWPGPETPTSDEMNSRQQALYDLIMNDAGDQTELLTELSGRIHAIVFRLACPVVPYDAKQDAWHGPTSAVWHAAWIAGLVGLCIQTGTDVPDDLLKQWDWFAAGHWPTANAIIGENCEPKGLLVF